MAGMYRVSDNWKTNVYSGAKTEPLELTKELTNLAIKAAKITKTEIAGVDIVESEEGLLVLEVNSIRQVHMTAAWGNLPIVFAHRSLLRVGLLL